MIPKFAQCGNQLWLLDARPMALGTKRRPSYPLCAPPPGFSFNGFQWGSIGFSCPLVLYPTRAQVWKDSGSEGTHREVPGIQLPVPRLGEEGPYASVLSFRGPKTSKNIQKHQKHQKPETLRSFCCHRTWRPSSLLFRPIPIVNRFEPKRNWGSWIGKEVSTCARKRQLSQERRWSKKAWDLFTRQSQKSNRQLSTD